MVDLTPEQVADGWIAGEPPKDGTKYIARMAVPVRWKPYKPNSEQFRSGITGRWQRMNGFGGWDNCDGAGRHYPFLEYAKFGATQ